jgi:hypothetical protein
MVTPMVGISDHGDWRAHGQRAGTGDMIVFPERGELPMALPPRAQWLSMQVPRQWLEMAGLSMSRCFEDERCAECGRPGSSALGGQPRPQEPNWQARLTGPTTPSSCNEGLLNDYPPQRRSAAGESR